MSVDKTLNSRGVNKNLSTEQEIVESKVDSGFSILPDDEALEDVRLEDVTSEGVKLETSHLNFSQKHQRNASHASFHHNGKTAHYRLDQIEKSIIEGTFQHVVETVAQPKFIKESYEKADSQGKADIKVLAAVAIAQHGEEIADGLRKNKTIEEIKDIPEHHIADVMKMSMQFGASSKSMNAFMNILHEAGKLPMVIEHLFRDVKSSDVINITSSVMRLGLDPTPLTCAQTAFRLMSYALDHSGVQQTKQPLLFKFVSTTARGFQIGSNVLEVAGNVAGMGMIAGVSSFLVHKVVDYSLRQNVNETVKYGDEDVKFSDAIIRLEKENEGEREANTRKRESERDARRHEIKKALKQSQQRAHNNGKEL